MGVVNLIYSPTYIHCYNHVLDLCLKEVLKNNTIAVNFFNFIKQSSTFYRSSPKLILKLLRAGEILYENLLSFKPVCDTRCADSLENAVILIILFTCLISHATVPFQDGKNLDKHYLKTSDKK